MRYESLQIYDKAKYGNLKLLIYTDGKEFYFVPRFRGEEAEKTPEGLREILSLYSAERIRSERGNIFQFVGDVPEGFENYEFYGESTNAVCFFDDMVLKSYRRIGSREPEMIMKLKGIAPPLIAYAKYNEKYIQIITSRIDGKDVGEIFYQNYLKFKDSGEIDEDIFNLMDKIVRTVMRMHGILAESKEEIGEDDVRRWRNTVRKFALNAGINIDTSRLFNGMVGKEKITTHQDLHLSQMVISGDRIYIMDFEGEPLRENREEKFPEIRDFSTLARSFGYITRGSCDLWERRMVENLYALYAKGKGYFTLRDYYEWMLEKALYEINYEMQFRPKMEYIPRRGVECILKILEVVE